MTWDEARDDDAAVRGVSGGACFVGKDAEVAGDLGDGHDSLAHTVVCHDAHLSRPRGKKSMPIHVPTSFVVRAFYGRRKGR